MKLKIKIKRIDGGIIPKSHKKGDWVDLHSNATFSLMSPQAGTLKSHTINGETVKHRDVSFDYFKIPLGVAMKLPKGFEAVVVPRSSSCEKFGIIQANSIGVIDNSYSGNNDEWKMPVVAIRDTLINTGDRVCQFRIQLSQKANIFQKIKWLLSSGIEIVEVESLDNKDRGGFGSTGR